MNILAALRAFWYRPTIDAMQAAMLRRVNEDQKLNRQALAFWHRMRHGNVQAKMLADERVALSEVLDRRFAAVFYTDAMSSLKVHGWSLVNPNREPLYNISKGRWE